MTANRYVMGPFFVTVEEDTYGQGCDPNAGHSHAVAVRFTGASAESVIAQAREMFGDGPDSELRGELEPDRVDFERMETAEGRPASEADIAQWKRGNLRLFRAVYSGHVYRCEPVNLTD